MRKPLWTLRTWLIVPAAAIVTILSATGAILQLDTLVRAWLASTRQLSELAARQVAEHITLRLENFNTESAAAGAQHSSTRENLLTQIDNDPRLGGLLESSAAGAHSIAEISVNDASGGVLASSNRSRPGNRSTHAELLTSLEQLSPLQRVRAVWAPGTEYEVRVPVGLKGDTQPLFIVQVLVSNALLRDSLSPGFNRIIGYAGLAYLVALTLVCVVAEITRRNLHRLGQLIDRIGEGTGLDTLTTLSLGKAATAEFDSVQSKLALMEGRVRGALHEAQDYRQRVGALLRGLEEAIILFESDRIVLAAGPVESLLGRAPDEINGHEAKDVFSEYGPVGRLISNARASHYPAHNVEMELEAHGRVRKLIANIDFIADGAEPPRPLTLLRLRDAESATAVESQLQIVNRLEAINRLTGGVAHEIKNPLNAIAARLALLESIVEGDAEAEGEIRVVAGEIQRLDRVVRTFLDFTQPLQMERQAVDLGKLAGEVVELVQLDASARGVDVSFTDDSAGAAQARGDRDLLQQAILNIVVNAIEAVPSGGQVRVIASASDRDCHLQITDNGPGIPDLIRKKIFQLYFTTKMGGSGIGLAVAYRSLQLHGGDIRIETQEGKGTTFHMTLPPLQREEAATVA